MSPLGILAPPDELPQLPSIDAARADERLRIADDLHDDVAQLLFAAQLTLETTLQRKDVDPDAATAIATAHKLLVRAEDAIRTMIHGLTPPDTADLDVRLRAMAARVGEELRLSVDVDLDDDAVATAHDLSQAMRDGLVRVAHEALVNTAKHAGPCRAWLQLSLVEPHRIVLTIADDGRSGVRATGTGGDARMRPHRGGHGLAALCRTMTAQGGTLSVRRDVCGTTVWAVTPPVRAIHHHESTTSL